MRLSAQAALAISLCVVGAKAANIQTFNLSGTLASSSSGVPSLAGGSFSGTYSVDVDQLPVAPSVSLALVGWNVQVRNSGGTIVQTFLNGAVTHSGILQGEQSGVQSDGLNFHDTVSNNRLTLAFFQGFGGTEAVQPSITTGFVTLNSEFQMNGALNLIGVTSGSSAAAASLGTPEPGTLTMLGAGALLLAGAKLRSVRGKN